MKCIGIWICLYVSVWGQVPPSSAQDQSRASASLAPQFAHARQLLQQGKYDTAISELEDLSKTQPALKGLAHELGMAYYKKGDYFHSAEYFKKALQQNAEDGESTQMLGISYYLAGNPGAAIPFLEKVQTWYPRANVDASYILGQCYIQTKDYPHARQAFAKMFDLAPDSAGSYLLTARMLFRQEFEPVALDYAQKAVALDPKLPRAHFLLGEIHLFESKIPEAVSDFQAELALNPSDAATYYKLADADSRIQKFDDAEKLLQRSIWLDPTSTGPYILMGKVLEKKGEPELAVRALQRAATMDPNNSVTHHLLGQAYRDLGKTEEAQRELELGGQLQSGDESQP
jgi:tetratricopeptide (TPR) repeat protein